MILSETTALPALLAALLAVLTGVLAGGELMVRAGVQPAIATLEPAQAIRARQAVIARLRWLVPSIALPALGVAVGAAATATAADAPEPYPWLPVAFLAAFWIVAAAGTVPINIRIADWDADAPPDDADAVVRRWAAIDLARCAAAVLAFAAAVVALIL